MVLFTMIERFIVRHQLSITVISGAVVVSAWIVKIFG